MLQAALHVNLDGRDSEYFDFRVFCHRISCIMSPPQAPRHPERVEVALLGQSKAVVQGCLPKRKKDREQKGCSSWVE